MSMTPPQPVSYEFLTHFSDDKERLEAVRVVTEPARLQAQDGCIRRWVWFAIVVVVGIVVLTHPETTEPLVQAILRLWRAHP